LFIGPERARLPRKVGGEGVNRGTLPIVRTIGRPDNPAARRSGIGVREPMAMVSHIIPTKMRGAAGRASRNRDVLSRSCSVETPRGASLTGGFLVEDISASV